jgi:hypothetical protein
MRGKQGGQMPRDPREFRGGEAVSAVGPRWWMELVMAGKREVTLRQITFSSTLGDFARQEFVFHASAV